MVPRLLFGQSQVFRAAVDATVGRFGMSQVLLFDGLRAGHPTLQNEHDKCVGFNSQCCSRSSTCTGRAPAAKVMIHADEFGKCIGGVAVTRMHPRDPSLQTPFQG